MSRTEVTLGTLMLLAQSGDRQAYRAVLETARGRLIVYFRRRLTADPVRESRTSAISSAMRSR